MATKTSTFFGTVFRHVLCLISMLAAVGCGAGFDSPDWVKSLRVLGIQKDQPYAPPTTDPANPTQVKLTMLDYNPTQNTRNPKTIQRLWFSGCDDLPGDQYFTCLLYMHTLWKLHSEAPRPEWQDGMSWSPLDDIMADPHLVNTDPNLTEDDRIKATDDNRKKAAQAVVSQVKPNFPLELAESYLGTFRIGSGPRFVYPIPPLIIDYHQPSSDPNIPAYGLSFIFFTLCSGHIDVAPNWQHADLGATLQNATLGFPFVCLDNGASTDAGAVASENSGNALGPDDFVSGYTQVFVPSDGTVNHNPVINGVRFNGKDLDAVADGAPASADTGAGADAGTDADAGSGADAGVAPSPGAKAFCIDGDCVPLPALDPCAGVPPSRHVPRCSGKCPTYEFSPTLDKTNDPNNPNNDSGKFDTEGGNPIGEQMWVDYYTDRGSLKHEVRLLRDANLGWSSDFSNQWTPPADAGPVNLWAVAHDTRGGTAWVRIQVCVDK